MPGVPISPRRVFGVSLSAGPRAGEATWVCRGHPGDAGLRIESVDPLAELPGGGVESREACRAIVGKVLEAPRSAWGFDFAFGLPATADGDEAPGPAPSLALWKAGLEAVTGAGGVGDLEGRDAPRRTDRERGLPAPLSAARSDATFEGIRGVLAPLHGKEGVAVLPIDPLPLLPDGTPPAMRARAPSTYLLESAPASVLGSLPAGTVEPVGEIPAEPGGRQAVIRDLVKAAWLRPVPRAIRERASESAAGLAAVLVAVGAWRGYRREDHGELCRDRDYGAEGYIYC